MADVITRPAMTINIADMVSFVTRRNFAGKNLFASFVTDTLAKKYEQKDVFRRALLRQRYLNESLEYLVEELRVAFGDHGFKPSREKIISALKQLRQEYTKEIKTLMYVGKNSWRLTNPVFIFVMEVVLIIAFFIAGLLIPAFILSIISIVRKAKTLEFHLDLKNRHRDLLLNKTRPMKSYYKDCGFVFRRGSKLGRYIDPKTDHEIIVNFETMARNHRLDLADKFTRYLLK